MSRLGMMWRHVVISTRSSWLPGDDRGWRSRGHKRHSSGDYKNPPPQGEHDELHKWVNDRAQQVVKIPWKLRARMGKEMVQQFLKRGYSVLCASVSERHVHLLVELPFDPNDAKRIVGLCKGASSHAVRDALPGNVWSEGGKYEPIEDASHHANAYDYILYKQGRAAFTWSFKDADLVFIPGRKRLSWKKTRAVRYNRN